MKLTAAGNTEVPAYELLKELGYDISRTGANTESENWIARMGELEFSARSLVELLGIVKLAESRGENWQASDEQIERFVGEFS